MEEFLKLDLRGQLDYLLSLSILEDWNREMAQESEDAMFWKEYEDSLEVLG